MRVGGGSKASSLSGSYLLALGVASPLGEPIVLERGVRGVRGASGENERKDEATEETGVRGGERCEESAGRARVNACSTAG